MALFKSALTVGSFTLVSRILGYIRDILIATFLGASQFADAFFVAFRLPNFFRQLSAEGAFNAAFVPLFSHKLTADGKEKALSFARRVLFFMIIALIIVTIVVEIFMEPIITVLAPGFLKYPEKFEITVYFARIVFPYLIFISITALFSGVMNSFGKFAAAAIVPSLLNISMIACLVLLTPYFPSAAHVLVIAVVIGGIIQLLWIVAAACREKIHILPERPSGDPDVILLLKRMVPGIIGGGVTQINLWINTVLATTVSGAVSYLYYADRLVQFPLAIIGTAMGTALLPTLSKHIKNKDFSTFKETQNRALEVVLLLTIPATFALLSIAPEIIHIMFERGAFGPVETQQTSNALRAYALGLPAFVMVKIFVTTFFSNGDTKTPVKIALCSLIFSVAVSLILLPIYKHVGLAIATSLGSWINTLLLIFIAYRRDLYQFNGALYWRLLKVTIVAIAMAATVYALSQNAAELLHGTLATKIIVFLGIILTGIVVFFLGILGTRTYRLAALKTLLQK
jgi:putative peptidoglycan lipid II flippase